LTNRSQSLACNRVWATSKSSKPMWRWGSIDFYYSIV